VKNFILADQPSLIAMDWGSTKVRAYLMHQSGSVLERKESEDGATRIAEGGVEAFETAFSRLTSEWSLTYPNLAVILCGMVGSRHGWREAPYLYCPTAISELHKGAVAPSETMKSKAWILPGLAMLNGNTFDVMRGEETQVCGILTKMTELNTACTVVLPGTHSKWVRVRNGCIESFRTYMTGEIFDLMLRHSVLRLQLVKSESFDPVAFEKGITYAERKERLELSAQLFSLRAEGLLTQVVPNELTEMLSGLLIGKEIHAELPNILPEEDVVIVGEEAVAKRYEFALKRRGLHPLMPVFDAAVAGMWNQACHAGLLG
jgi:2-dehydro-3-deoxygalactonokinase